jgi:hypothetical protein
MEKWQKGLAIGALAGIVDVIPMLLQNLTWDANLSAFFFWVASGFVIATADVPLKGAAKGIAVSYLLLVPLAFLIGWANPMNLAPIVVMTLILGAAVGIVVEKFH